MKSDNTKIPLISLVILLASSFIPIVQVVLLHLNGAFLYPFEFLFSTTEIGVLNNVNLIGAIICLFAYAVAKRVSVKILWVVLTFFFLSSFISYATEGWSYEKYPYSLPFMLQAIAVMIPLYLIGLVKERRRQNKSQ